MSARLRGWLTAVGLLAALAGGGLAGSALGERASRPGTETLTLASADAAGTGVATPLRSAAGFTGFEGRPALGGAVVRVGAVEHVQERALTVVEGAGTFEVSLTQPLRLFRIVEASRPLQAGDIVLLRVASDGTPQAALRVPADLYEGDSRGETLRSQQGDAP
ncbi:MAG: hypothetical protein AMXMBFR23_03580 [Chloroflexota bacterium]